MTGVNDNNHIGFDEAQLDTPIYRIYAQNRFEALLKSSRDALINPAMWDDPFENFFLARTELFDASSNTTIPLDNLAADWYGQCWSLNDETDAMWRIYSSQKVGVKVKTTVRRLFENLRRVDSTAPSLQFFIGRVTYADQHAIEQLMRGLTFMDIARGGSCHGFAKLLCLKREAFQHENEVRLLFQDIDRKQGVGNVFEYPLDVGNMFDEVVLDPRLKDVEAANLTSALQLAGYKRPISQSTLYQAPHFVIQAQ